MPSGSHSGKRWDPSWRVMSLSVNVVVPPPEKDTRRMPEGPVPARIVPSGPHAPPRGSGTPVISNAGPPTALTLLSFPSAKNPTDKLSGDQNGRSAPSVPGIACAVPVSKRRSHSMGRAPVPAAVKTIERPSGDRASCGAGTLAMGGPVSTVPSGGLILSRTISGSAGAGLR